MPKIGFSIIKRMFSAIFNFESHNQWRNFGLKIKTKIMETKIIKGDLIKDKIFNEVKTEISMLREKYHAVPGIAFIGYS